MSKTTLGIDEAGRGPALGPMVLAAVLLDTKGAAALSKAGLADSKSFGSGKRAKTIRNELAEIVVEHALFYHVECVSVRRLDPRVLRSELNLLEREIAERMIEKSPAADRIVCDGARLFSPLCETYPHLEAVNDGESAHVSVAAASVLAKTRRDAEFAKIAKKYEPEFGELRGGGYVNAATKSFLQGYAEKHGELPPEARKSWPYPYLVPILGEEACFPVKEKKAKASKAKKKASQKKVDKKQLQPSLF